MTSMWEDIEENDEHVQAVTQPLRRPSLGQIQVVAQLCTMLTREEVAALIRRLQHQVGDR